MLIRLQPAMFDLQDGRMGVKDEGVFIITVIQDLQEKLASQNSGVKRS